MSEIVKGSRVYYLPHLIHALNRDISGEMSWVMGHKKVSHYQTGFPGQMQAREEVVELSGVQLDKLLDAVKRHPNSAEAGKFIVPVRPRSPWPAIVTAINPDGTVDLDVQSNNGGVTLHYGSVPVSEADEPHTCRLAQNVGAQEHLVFDRLHSNTPAHVREQ
jgi:hypothetical protein